MIKTNIFTTRKLEKTTNEFISSQVSIENEFLGNWTATLFYVSNKKCWLIINKLTKYLVIIPNVKKSDLKNISTIFKKTLYFQLNNDGIKTDYTLVDKIIGEINLCETNNDRSTSGSLNNCLFQMDDWKKDYGTYDNMPFRDLNNKLNSSPNKMLNWKYPKEKMDEMIKAYAQQRTELKN